MGNGGAAASASSQGFAAQVLKGAVGQVVARCVSKRADTAGTKRFDPLEEEDLFPSL
jgi:hypothetical protein